MRPEIKELVKEELQAIQKSKISMVIGIGMVILDVLLVVTSFISIYSLIFTLPLIYVVRKSYVEYQLNQAMIIFTRMLVDDEFETKK